MTLRGVTLGSVMLAWTALLPALGQTPTSRPVTDAMLQSPDAGEWLHWRGASRDLVLLIFAAAIAWMGMRAVFAVFM